MESTRTFCSFQTNLGGKKEQNPAFILKVLKGCCCVLSHHFWAPTLCLHRAAHPGGRQGRMLALPWAMGLRRAGNRGPLTCTGPTGLGREAAFTGPTGRGGGGGGTWGSSGPPSLVVSVVSLCSTPHAAPVFTRRLSC